VSLLRGTTAALPGCMERALSASLPPLHKSAAPDDSVEPPLAQRNRMQDACFAFGRDVVEPVSHAFAAV
jgi:hypothetical protein